MQSRSINSISINVAFVRAATAKLACEQAEIDALLMAAKIPPALLLQPQARVSLHQFAQLITLLIRATKDEMLGHTHHVLPIGGLSILTHWMTGATTIGQAVHRLSRFYSIMNRDIDIVTSTDEQFFTLTLEEGSHNRDSDEYVYEFMFFFVHRILCWLQKHLFPIAHIAFPFREPSHAQDHRLMYYGAPVSYHQPTAKIVFAKALLAQPVKQDLKALKTMLDNPIGSLLMLNFHGESWSSKVGSIAQNRLPNLPSLPEIAAEIKLQPYTLQRRLKQEGVTYLEIKNQIKRDAAIELLTNSELSIDEISTQLGFVETSPFTRIFKQWTGVPPSAYRKRQH